MAPPDSNLPRRRKRFIGRSTELERLDSAVREAPLVTIVGGGGMGKTRLAMQYGSTVSRFDRVTFCELTEATSLDALIAQVAESLDLEMTSVGRPEQLGKVLAELGNVLLIADNLEQVVEPAADAFGYWLDQAPNISFLATSREPLHLRGERKFQLSPLSSEEAIELFEHRAQQVRPGFQLNESNRETVAAIVERLDAIPLAVELAASRINVFAPTNILERLNERDGGLNTLVRRTRNATVRHQTMHGTVEWSWNLLDPEERQALAGISVFRGGFDLRAAEAILGDYLEGPVGPLLESLVDKSLVNTVSDPTTGGRRFELFETISRFASTRLEEEPRERLERLHAEYYIDLLDETDPSEAFHEAGNIEKAFHAMSGRDDELTAKAALSAYHLLELRGLYPKIQELIDEALDAGIRVDALRAKLRGARADCLYEQGYYSEALDDIEKALVAAKAAGDTESQTYLLYCQAAALRAQGKPTQAMEPLNEALDIAENEAHQRGIATIRGTRAMVELELRRLDKAHIALSETLALARGYNLPDLAARTLVDLSRCETQLGELESAESRLDKARRLHPGGDQRFRLRRLEQRGALAWYRGRHAHAYECFRRALEGDAPIGGRHRQIPIRFGLSSLDKSDGQEDAESHLQDVLEMVWDTEDVPYRVQVRTRLALLHLRREAYRNAAHLLQQAAEEVETLEDDRLRAHIRAWWSVAEAGFGRHDHSASLLDDAREWHATDENDHLAEDIDFFERAGAFLADKAVEDAPSLDQTVKDLREVSKRRRTEPDTRIWGWHCYDYLLELADLLEQTVTATPSKDVLSVARDGHLCVLPDGEQIDLSSRTALRRILADLAQRRDTDGAEGASVEELRESGWPDAKLTESAGKSRVYTAVRNLRSMGLDDILLTSRSGYVLDPDIPFEWID